MACLFPNSKLRPGWLLYLLGGNLTQNDPRKFKPNSKYLQTKITTTKKIN